MISHFQLNYERFLPEDSEATILDYGSGYGSFCLWLKLYLLYRNVSWFDCGYDKTHLAHPFRIENKSKFDFIFSRDVIYYFDDLYTETKELVDCLKPGGRILIEVFNGAMPSARVIRSNDWRIKHSLSDVMLRELMESCGVQVLYVGGERYNIKVTNFLWLFFRQIYFLFLKSCVVLERGFCERNPKVYGKAIIFYGEKK